MTWLSWPIRIAVFAAWFAKEFAFANARVLRDNLTPGQNSTPGIARFATRCRTDTELTVFAALITLTPGTLTVGTETAGDGTRMLFVHGMYATDPDALRNGLQDTETRLLYALRRRGSRS